MPNAEILLTFSTSADSIECGADEIRQLAPINCRGVLSKESARWGRKVSGDLRVDFGTVDDLVFEICEFVSS